MDLVFDTASPDETQQLGAALGRVLEAGDVVGLAGPLGAGKTCFVQGLARGLGVPPERRVASPSFTIVNEHPGRVPLYHVDLYRIEEAGELDHLGLDEYLDGGGVTVVEWFDRFADRRPPDRLDVEIEITGAEARRLHARARGPRAHARLSAWQAIWEGEP
jgi:tRNA threonylcarbamoyladenosine biosynthesis protein TsaE